MYAPLASVTAAVGSTVTAGSVLGKTTADGYLHFVYTPNGGAFVMATAVDPNPCFCECHRRFEFLSGCFSISQVLTLLHTCCLFLFFCVASCTSLQCWCRPPTMAAASTAPSCQPATPTHNLRSRPTLRSLRSQSPLAVQRTLTASCAHAAPQVCTNTWLRADPGVLVLPSLSLRLTHGTHSSLIYYAEQHTAPVITRGCLLAHKLDTLNLNTNL